MLPGLRDRLRDRSVYITEAGTEDKMVGQKKFCMGKGWVARN